MNEQTEVTLTGSDGSVSGILRPITHDGYTEVYEFTSLDETLHLIITRDEDGKWIRLAGSEPYFSGWVDELAEQIITINNTNNE